MKTGSGILQAIEAVGQTSNPPMGDELRRAVRKINLNVTPFEALMDVSGRNDSPEFETIARAVAITQHTGGSLADVLDRVAGEIREQIRVKGVVRVLTSQGRASAWVVGILPFAIGGLLFLIEPEYFNPMLTNPLGIGMLIASFVMVGLGLALIRAMARIEV
jgi:tight adherence protein B